MSAKKEQSPEEKLAKSGVETEAKTGVGEMRTVREKVLSDSARLNASPVDKGPDPEAVKRDPNVPNALASGTIEDEMPGITNPRDKLDAKRTGAEALRHLMSGPHAPEVTIIDGEPLKTGDTGQAA